MSELKPCPHCGSPATRLVGTEDVRCSNQTYCSHDWISEKHWNHRTPDPAVARLVEAADVAIELLYSMPSGVDEEADENNASPEDASAHIAGLIYKYLKSALAPFRESEKEKA